MNKTRIILAATGGVIALAVAAAAVFAFLAFAERTAAFEGDDESDGLDGAVGRIEQLQRKRPYPCAENKTRLDANSAVVGDWCAAVRKEVSRGDWCAPRGFTPAQFKEQIARDAKAIVERPSRYPDGEPIVKPDFAFGPFKEYLADKMPATAQLPRLQRQWYDLTSLVELLATNGIRRLVDVQVVDRAAEEAAKAAQEAKGKRNAKPKAKAKKASPEARAPSVETYRLTFTALPADFAAILRTLSFQERFTVVEDFAFRREADSIAEALGGGEKKKEAPAAAGRRGRRRGAARETKPAEGEKGDGTARKSVVFDPESDAVVRVDLTVSVYDFHTLEDEGEEAAK